jgi:putative sigma-54 modulation protein
VAHLLIEKYGAKCYTVYNPVPAGAQSEGGVTMQVNITGIKTSVRPSFKERAEKKIAKFDRFFNGDTEAHVKVTAEHGQETVEITIFHRGMIYRAQRTANDRNEALDYVVDVLFKQIVKNKRRLEKNIDKAAFANIAPVELSGEDAHEDFYEIVRTKRFILKPMDVPEAILQMNMLGHSFFAFLSAESGMVSIVYKRQRGDYGLIELDAD